MLLVLRVVGGEDDAAGGDLGLVDRRAPAAGGAGSRDSTQENCGVLTAGICTIVMCTLLLSCSSSVRTDSVNPLMACLAPQYADCSGIDR